MIKNFLKNNPIHKKIAPRLDYLMLLRPTLFFSVWVMICIGMYISSILSNTVEMNIIDYNAHTLIMFFGITLVCGSTFIINQLSDVDSDRINNKVFLLNGMISSKDALKISKIITPLDKVGRTVSKAMGSKYIPKTLIKTETKINWSLGANKVIGHIHGLSPNPGAWFEYENERFKILRAKISTANGKASCALDDNLTVACKSNSIKILELQRQGKNKQTAKEFLLGKKINSGSILN